MDYILGTDWSVYQGRDGVSASFAKQCDRGGVQFLFNRATLGTGYRDPSFVPNVQRAADLGWVTGGYHFLYGSALAKAAAVQAESFVRALEAVPGPVRVTAAVVDVEWAGDDRDDWPRYRDVVAFIRRFRELLPGHPIGIYTAEGYWVPMCGNRNGDAIADYLWQARWIDGDPIEDVTLPARPPRAGFGGWGTTPLWQWGSLKVGARRIDGNAFYGTLGDLRSWVTTVRPPIPERPNYAKGYEAGRAAIEAAIPGVPVPPGPKGPAYPAGVAAAREDAIAAVGRLKAR